MRRTFWLWITVLTIAGACTETTSPPEYTNPFDEKNPEYTEPQAVLNQAPDDGTILTDDSVKFEWEGNRPESKFTYCLMGYDNSWSDYTKNTQATYPKLDDKEYVFLVKEQYKSGAEQKDSTYASFEIDAVEGPAFVIEKQYVESQTGKDITLNLIAEEVTDLMGYSIKILYNPDKIQLKNIREASGFFDADADGTSFLQSTGADGWIKLEGTRLGGNPAGVEGTGVLAKLTFNSGNYTKVQMQFASPAECLMRNSNNESITINQTRGATLVIE